MTTKKLTVLSMMAAISILLIYLLHFPIFPAAPFLEYDPADIPIFMCTFLFGPLTGLLLCVVVSFLQGILISSTAGIVGIMMHIVATGSFVLVAGNIYKRNKTRKNAAIALLAGVITMTVVMCLWNIVITPLYMKIPVSEFLKLLLPVILPFNLIKAGANALITFLLYKRIAGFIRSRQLTEME